jgi:orotate phosphoribosyltransferase
MDSQERALKVAEFLLRIKAVELNPEHPFTWASGLKSPIYCDNRKTLSYPEIRTYLREAFISTITENYPKPDVIAGVATGGIAIGALIAQSLNLPFVYVRSEAKKHGLGNQVEGVLKPGQKVVVIEDLISTGKSSLNAVQALREQEAEISGMIAIFSYGFDTASKSFAANQCKMTTLSNYDALLKQALSSGYINSNQLVTLQEWKNNPESWSQIFTTQQQAL